MLLTIVINYLHINSVLSLLAMMNVTNVLIILKKLIGVIQVENFRCNVCYFLKLYKNTQINDYCKYSDNTK